ncbi:MAG: endonuclease Q family protein [Candidatus Levybacteria bacterium]|nr:endonuclease Q family protein [Candidatus Levybacteria bacterium]
MRYVADLHLHSKYSRAVSKDMVLSVMAEYAKKKGIDILTTADWTHPLWFREIRNQLEEYSPGIFKLKSKVTSTSKESGGHLRGVSGSKETLFMLTTEISSIYSQGGKTRRIHNLVFSPSFETAEKINQELFKRGCNLSSDGRPIIGLFSQSLIELLLSIDERILLIPCHAWTPWFALYGSMSGFDSIDECFGEYSKYIYAIETGLSSDPDMNWRIKELDNRSIVSFSDAHSPAKMGREATVFEIDTKILRYEDIRQAIIGQSSNGVGMAARMVKRQTSNVDDTSSETDKRRIFSHIACTIEFYPEEGKYHYTGHRNCKVVQSPGETKTEGVICPVCRRPLTVGVMQRVQDLARELKIHPDSIGTKFKIDEYGVKWIEDPTKKHPPFVRLVPLIEIIAESLGMGVSSVKVKTKFDEICAKFGCEIDILLKTDILEIERTEGPKIAEGIKKVRSGDIVVEPGFDGEYGKVKIWQFDKVSDQSNPEKEKESSSFGQLTFDL